MFSTVQGLVQQADLSTWTNEEGIENSYITIFFYDKDAFLAPNKVLRVTMPVKIAPKSIRNNVKELEGKEIKLIGSISYEPHNDKSGKFQYMGLKFRPSAIADVNGDLLTD